MNEALRMIQHRLNAPKNQYNKFGNYSYRSCESILEAVKPLLNECGAELVLSDKIVMMGDRFYVEATAMFTNAEGDTVITTAFAREPASKKGMDESQITGTASSYARKYALNGLFLIDDAKDADTNEYKQEHAAKAEQDDPKISADAVEKLEGLAAEKGVSIDAICQRYGVGTLQDLKMSEWVSAVRSLEKTKRKETA